MDIYPQDLGEELESQVRDVPTPRMRVSLPPVHPRTVGIWFLIGIANAEELKLEIERQAINSLNRAWDTDSQDERKN